MFSAARGEVDAAIASYHTALSLKPDFALALNNLGNALKDKGDLQTAIDSYQAALSLAPDYAQAHNNRGSALQDAGDFDQAIASFRQALHLQPDFAEAHNNLGGVLLETGDLEGALAEFREAVALRPDFAFAASNLHDLLVQFANTQEFVDDAAYVPTQACYAHPQLGIKFHVQDAIAALLHGHPAPCRASLDQVESLLREGALEKLPINDRVFCNAYLRFLGAILATMEPEAAPAGKLLYHLGESHALSFAHSTLMLNGVLTHIEPRLCFGAKAWHLARARTDRYKAIVRRHLEHLPEASEVLVSFGEIDCRLDEGILVTHRNKGVAIDTLVGDTVNGYLDFLMAGIRGRKHRLLVSNVPAPVYRGHHSKQDNRDRADLIRQFNTAVAAGCRQRDLAIVDVYTPTLDDSGYANGHFHCDDIHLSPAILPLLERQLS